MSDRCSCGDLLATLDLCDYSPIFTFISSGFLLFNWLRFRLSLLSTWHGHRGDAGRWALTHLLGQLVFIFQVILVVAAGVAVHDLLEVLLLELPAFKVFLVNLEIIIFILGLLIIIGETHQEGAEDMI